VILLPKQMLSASPAGGTGEVSNPQRGEARNSGKQAFLQAATGPAAHLTLSKAVARHALTE
jgi:hypothetical protein